MRKSGDWMSIWDDRVLEYILENNSGTPTEIANSEYFHVSKQHISRRLNRLADHGLLNSLGNGVYQINKKGRHYLIGNFDAEEKKYTNFEISNLDIRASPYDEDNQVRVVDINLDPQNEEDAIDMIYNHRDSLKSLLAPVLLQLPGKNDEVVTEEDVEIILEE